MNILVFGKDGQLGKAFSALLGQPSVFANAQITYLGRVECDLSNEANVHAHLNAAKPNLIINASAYTAVDKAESEVDLAFAVNAKAPEMMARYAAENDATFLHYSTDYVFADTKSDKTFERLTALKTAKNGFELAEYDLKFRGSGGLSEGKQWGVSDIAMEALQNLKMVEAARTEAKAMIEADINLQKYPEAKKHLKHRSTEALHWE